MRFFRELIVEMADNCNEGLVYGLLTTTHNLGGPFARAIGNQIFGLFQPSLSDAANYLADTPRFRDTVAVSLVLSYGVMKEQITEVCLDIILAILATPRR